MRTTGRSRTGTLLVASPGMVDPNFARTVVLVVADGDDGTIGVVINRPTPLPLEVALPAWAPCAAPPSVTFQGGPVDPETVVALTPAAVDPDAWTRVAPGIGVVDLTADPVLVGVERLRVFLGYAGWAPGQLADEVAAGGWYEVAATSEDVFTEAPDTLWPGVLRRRGGIYSTFAPDPSRN